MDFRTIVKIPHPQFCIAPTDRMLFVGSCFAGRMGCRLQEERLRVTVNPDGVMYNPASVLHTIERLLHPADSQTAAVAPVFDVAVLTLGTNHVYVEKSTGEIVDNCRKRPQNIFDERDLSVETCATYLQQAITLLRQQNPQVKVVLTVSPIRYAKYGFHGSQLSKATLLLAVNAVVASDAAAGQYPFPVTYFPAYEIVLDELRDYRFYQTDMLHPSDQAVEYIYERFSETFFSNATKQYLDEWRPVKEALAHRPFHPDSAEYKAFLAKTHQRETEVLQKYGLNNP